MTNDPNLSDHIARAIRDRFAGVATTHISAYADEIGELAARIATAPRGDAADFSPVSISTPHGTSGYLPAGDLTALAGHIESRDSRPGDPFATRPSILDNPDRIGAAPQNADPIDLDELRRELKGTAPGQMWADGVACPHGRIKRDCEWCTPVSVPAVVAPQLHPATPRPLHHQECAIQNGDACTCTSAMRAAEVDADQPRPAPMTDDQIARWLQARGVESRHLAFFIRQMRGLTEDEADAMYDAQHGSMA